MSLQVWLPLNGDLKNYGLDGSGFFINNSAVWGDGKIGSKAYLTSTGTNTATFSSLVGVKEFSIAYWLKIDSSLTFSNYLDFWQVWYTNQTGTNVIRDEHTNTAGKHLLELYKENNVGSNTNTYWGCSVNGANDVWVHIVLTKNTTQTKTYCNGVLKQTLNNTVYESSTGSLTGKVRIGNATCGAYLNDFRIYDHCLSLKEVKEIAKGLVLHYPLNKPLPNLIVGSDKYLLNKPYTHTSSAKDGAKFMGSDLWMPCVPGKTYTFLFNTDGIWSPTHDASGNGGGKTHFYLYLMENSTNPGSYARPVDLTNNFKVNDNITGLGIWTYTIPTDKAYTKIMFRVDIHSNGSTSYTCHYWNFKAEEGNKATAWIPNESDPLYAAAGYASGIVYDCSGYLNNGIEVGTITGSSDTPRYRSSTVFIDSCALYIKGPLLEWMKDNDFTMSCWFYKKTHERTSNGTKALGNLFIFSLGRDWYGSSDTNYYGVSIVSNQGGGILIYMGNTSFTSTINIPLNTWAHVVLTYDGTTAKLYINGELNTSKAIDKSTLKWGNASNAIVIGKMAHNNVSDTTYFPFVGNISDCRVYATALSAADIKALYSDAGYVDKNGNFHAYEFVEE